MLTFHQSLRNDGSGHGGVAGPVQTRGLLSKSPRVRKVPEEEIWVGHIPCSVFQMTDAYGAFPSKFLLDFSLLGWRTVLAMASF